MRRLSIFLATALLVLQSVAWAHDEEMQAELLDEVLRLTQAEIPDDIILEQIRAWEFTFELSADDIVELRTLGVSDVVLEALIATSPLVEVDTHSNVVLTAGYYAPWYWFPVAWGGYWDPFPNLYCAYYYPFHYGYAGFGYYGWCGSTYYAHYSPGHWQREAWHRRGGGGARSPYTLASGLPSRRAGTMTSPAVAPESRQRADTPNVIRGSTSARSSAALQRATDLRRAPSARGAQSAATVRTTRRAGSTAPTSRTVQREIDQRRAPASRLGTASVRTARPATPPSRLQTAPPSRGSTLSVPRASSWSRQAPSRAPSAPRFQSMSRGGAPARSMAAPPSVAGRLGGRSR